MQVALGGHEQVVGRVALWVAAQAPPTARRRVLSSLTAGSVHALLSVQQARRRVTQHMVHMIACGAKTHHNCTAAAHFTVTGHLVLRSYSVLPKNSMWRHVPCSLHSSTAQPRSREGGSRLPAASKGVAGAWQAKSETAVLMSRTGCRGRPATVDGHRSLRAAHRPLLTAPAATALITPAAS